MGEKGLTPKISGQGHGNRVLCPPGASLSTLCAAKDDCQGGISPRSLEDPLVACKLETPGIEELVDLAPGECASPYCATGARIPRKHQC